MNKSFSELADRLFTIASSELLLYKGMLSSTRLISIDLKNGGVRDSDDLYEKQKSYMDKIDSVHKEYASAIKGIENKKLESILFLKSPISATEFPEFTQVFSVLSELQITIEKITELNNYAIEQSSKLSLECMEKIKDLQRQKTFYSKFKTQNTSAGSLFNFQEKQ